MAQLAIEYCNALVDDTNARTAFFPGFNFGHPAVAFDAAGRAIMLDPLVGRMLRTTSAPNRRHAVRTELDGLITKLTACGGSCAADRTATVVKATCAALLGSAVTLVN